MLRDAHPTCPAGREGWWNWAGVEGGREVSMDRPRTVGAY